MTRNRFGSMILTAAVAGSIALGLAPVADATAPASPLAACKHEDGSGQPKGQMPCLWDATVRGNHKGRSFILSAPGIEQGSVADVGLDPITLDQLDASDELASAIRALPAKQQTAAMKAALRHYDQNAR